MELSGTGSGCIRLGHRGCAEEGLWGKLGVIVLPLGWSSSTAWISEERLKVHPGQEDGLQQWGTSVSTWQETLGLETEEV